MKNAKLFYTLLIAMCAALILCGCSKNDPISPETTENIPAAESFSNVDVIYREVLEGHASRGYTLLDLDGNGTEELLITDGDQIYELYAICDDGQLHMMLERNRYIVEMKLCSDNRIFVHETDFNGCDYYSILAMRTQVGNLPQELFVLCDGDRWWAGPYEKDAQLTTEEDAKALLDALEFQQIEFTPFS